MPIPPIKYSPHSGLVAFFLSSFFLFFISGKVPSASPNNGQYKPSINDGQYQPYDNNLNIKPVLENAGDNDDGQYRPTNDGQYVPDYSGQYVPDYSGRYKPGFYPGDGPDGPGDGPNGPNGPGDGPSGPNGPNGPGDGPGGPNGPNGPNGPGMILVKKSMNVTKYRYSRISIIISLAKGPSMKSAICRIEFHTNRLKKKKKKTPP